MKYRNIIRFAALILTLMIALSLAACKDSGHQGNQQQDNDHSANTIWNGLWVGEDEVLQIFRDEPVAMLFFMETDGFYMGAQNNADAFCGYNYTIHGNVLKLENMYTVDGFAPDDGVAPESMELTLESDRLVSGDKVYVKFTDKSGRTEMQQPAVSEPTVSVAPVQTQPVATAPAVSTNMSGWYGVWDSGSWLLEINPDYALAYNIDNAEDEFDQSVCISDIWDCDYVMDGNTMKMDCYDMAGNLMDSQALTLEGGFLCTNGDPVFLKHTNNTGISDNMEGTWYAMPNAYFEFESGWDNASGDIITFYGDGTCLIQWSEGSSDTHDGYYQMTTKFDNPAIKMVLDGIERGTYEYEFLSNDLLMIYTDNERCYGFLLYRK